jgi:DNA-binding IclR family transcriptional regulator
MESYTDTTLTTPEALDAELNHVRADGWAMSRGERCEGSVAVAVPLRDPQSGRVHALTVLAPQERFNAMVQRQWLDELRACAARVEVASSGAMH